MTGALSLDEMEELVREAAKDVLGPMVDAGQLDASMFGVSDIAKNVARRFGELLDERDDRMVGDGSEAPF